MYKQQIPDLLQLLRAQAGTFSSIKLTVHGQHKVHEGKLCIFYDGELVRPLTLAEVILLSAHDAVPSPLGILSGTVDQARYLMRELRIHPQKAVILSHYAVFHRLRAVDNLVVIKYGTYLERPDFVEVAKALEERGAAFYLAWYEMLSEMGDLREYLDSRQIRAKEQVI